MRPRTPNYSAGTLLADLLAGVTVAIVALPLAMAFGISAGMGAAAGITTAVVAGFVAAVFGGSRYQVSGPTGAMVVVLAPLFSSFGQAAVLFVGFGAGIILLCASILKLGRHVHKLPTSLVEGFTAGIAVVIATSQCPELSKSATSLTVGFAAAAVIYAAGHYLPRVPVSLAVVLLLTLLNHIAFELPTVQDLPTNLLRFDLEFLNQSKWLVLLVPMLSVAALAALESLLSARVADHLAHAEEEHNADHELRGQGFANLASAVFGGMPATAALARTAVNVKSGAKTRMAAAIHALLLAVIVLLLGPVFSQIPLTALAGVLVATAAHMVKPSELFKTAKTSKLDAIVLVTTLLATIFTNLTTAVVIGAVIWFSLRKTRLKTTEPPVNQDETLGD